MPSLRLWEFHDCEFWKLTLFPTVSMMGPQKLAGFARSSERRRRRFGSFAGCGRSWPVVGVVGYHKGNLKTTYIFLSDFLEILGGVISQLGVPKNTNGP